MGTNLLTDARKTEDPAWINYVFRVQSSEHSVDCYNFTARNWRIISSEWHASPIFLFIIYLSLSLSLSLSHIDTQQLHNSFSLLSSWNLIFMLKFLALISWIKMEANFSTQDHGRSLWMINFNFGSFHSPVNVRIYHCLQLDSTLRRPRSSVKECPCQNQSAWVWQCREKINCSYPAGNFCTAPLYTHRHVQVFSCTYACQLIYIKLLLMTSKARILASMR